MGEEEFEPPRGGRPPGKLAPMLRPGIVHRLDMGTTGAPTPLFLLLPVLSFPPHPPSSSPPGGARLARTLTGLKHASVSCAATHADRPFSMHLFTRRATRSWKRAGGTGLMVVAKDATTQWHLSDQFKAHTVGGTPPARPLPLPPLERPPIRA